MSWHLHLGQSLDAKMVGTILHYMEIALLKLHFNYSWHTGLRLFKEAKDREFHGKVGCIYIFIFELSNLCLLNMILSLQWDDHPAIMAVGVIDGSSEAIFQTLMSLGPSRSE